MAQRLDDIGTIGLLLTGHSDTFRRGAWCFDHKGPMPCASCQTIKLVDRRCFDCKHRAGNIREFAPEQIDALKALGTIREFGCCAGEFTFEPNKLGHST